MGVATERFSDRKQYQTLNGNWEATRGWDVIAYSDEYDAVNSTGVVTGSQHPLSPCLTCTKIGVTENKLTKARVVATYAVTNLPNQTENPLNRTPLVSWNPTKNSEDIDTDMNGNPILNSCLDAFRSNFKRNFTVKFLSVRRWEPYWDQATSDLYTDTTNDGPITFYGYEYDAGQVYLHRYAPVAEYPENAPYVEVKYDFEIRTPTTPNLTDLQIRYPFQLRILDQGERGWFHNAALSTTSLGHFALSDGNLVTHGVLLNGSGEPLDTTIKVSSAALPVIPQSLPDTVLMDTVTTDDNVTAVFLIYMRYAETDFSQIGVGG